MSSKKILVTIEHKDFAINLAHISDQILPLGNMPVSLDAYLVKMVVDSVAALPDQGLGGMNFVTSYSLLTQLLHHLLLTNRPVSFEVVGGHEEPLNARGFDYHANIVLEDFEFNRKARNCDYGEKVSISISNSEGVELVAPRKLGDPANFFQFNRYIPGREFEYGSRRIGIILNLAGKGAFDFTTFICRKSEEKVLTDICDHAIQIFKLAPADSSDLEYDLYDNIQKFLTDELLAAKKKHLLSYSILTPGVNRYDHCIDVFSQTGKPAELV